MQDLVAEFRSVQTADESLATLDRALRLAERVASGAGRTRGRAWLNLQSGQKGEMNSAATFTPLRRLDSTTRLLSEISTRLRDQKARILDEQYSLLADTLLLVFHQAFFALLPAVPARRGQLLDTFRQFASTLDRPADRFQLLGLIALEEKNADDAAEAFRIALAATHADEHDFLTRVQLLWSVLMSHGHMNGALDLLLDVYPRVPHGGLEEITGLLRETFHEAKRTSNIAARVRKRA